MPSLTDSAHAPSQMQSPVSIISARLVGAKLPSCLELLHPFLPQEHNGFAPFCSSLIEMPHPAASHPAGKNKHHLAATAASAFHEGGQNQKQYRDNFFFPTRHILKFAL